MGLINESRVNTSIGIEMTNTFCDVKFNTSEMLSTGIVKCGLNWYSSEEEFDRMGVNKNIFPVDENGKMVTDISFSLIPTDVVKQSGTCRVSDVAIFFFQKAADKLEELYGWQITITE